MRRVLSRAATVAICCSPAALAPALAQTPGPSAAPALLLIKAGRLIDGRADAPQSNVGILVEGERIGRASCRERGEMAGGGGALKTERRTAMSSDTVDRQ